MKKRIFSLVMVFCMLISVFSFPAFAEDEEINAWFDINGTGYLIGSDNVPHTENDGEEGTTALPDGVSYDYATNTLTLSGAELTSLWSAYSGWDEENGWQWYNLPKPDLTVVLEGENSIINPEGGVNGDYNALGLTNGVNVTIKGSGSLTVEAQNTSEDEWVGRAVSVSSHSSLTITDSAHVTVKVTGESCEVSEDNIWSDFIAVEGDTNTDCELTVSENAVLEAYGDCGGIRFFDITVKDNAQIKSNMISLYINTPEQCEQDGNDPSEIEEGLAPRVMTVEDNAVVDICASYETEIEGNYEALVLETGSQLLVKGGTVNVTQDSGVTSWENGDTGIACYFDSDLYDSEKDKDMLPAIHVTGGELNVDSCFVGIQMGGGVLDVSGGSMNVTGGRFGVYTYGPSSVALSGGAFNAESTEEYSTAAIIYEGDLVVTGGSHTFGNEKLTSAAGLAGPASLHFDGGTTKIYGSVHALESVAYQWFDENLDSLDPENLPIDETVLACPVEVGSNMVVTDAGTGEKLSTLGAIDFVNIAEDNGNLVGYEYDRYYSYTTDGSTEIKTDENGNWVNCATAISIAEDVTTNPFVDIDSDAYYYNAVLWAVGNNVTTGTTSTTFSPDDTCTRAQAMTFLWRAAGSPAPASTANPFTDVKSDAYYYDAVLWAVEKGITTGTTETTFSPDDTITRDQAVTFLYRHAGSPAVSGSNAFTDVSADAYYANAVQWAVANKVVYGTSTTTFGPDDPCTRGQIVTFLWRDLAE